MKYVLVSKDMYLKHTSHPKTLFYGDKDKKMSTDDLYNNPPKEYIEFFIKRQKNHEARVKKNAKRIAENFPQIAEDLLKQAESHDKSKWGKEEYCGYIWLTAHLNLDVPYPNKEIEKLVNKCWEHHYTNNSHHPEYWKNNILKMSEIELAHMVADWAAMSQEFGTSLKSWWEDKASKRYKFTNSQIAKIEQYLDIFFELS